MNRIRRLRRTLARLASSPGRAEPQASQPKGQEPHLASRPGREAFAAQFTPELAAGPSVVAGQNRPTPATVAASWRPGRPIHVGLRVGCRVVNPPTSRNRGTSRDTSPAERRAAAPGCTHQPPAAAGGACRRRHRRPAIKKVNP